MRWRRNLLICLAYLIVGIAPSDGGEPAADKKPARTPPHSTDPRDTLPVGAVLRLGDVRFWWKNCYIGSLAFSPDGKTLAVAAGRYQFERNEESAVRLLEIPSGAERRRLKNLPLSMSNAAFSPDGKSLAGIHSLDGGFSLGLSVWDLDEGTRRYGLKLGNQQSTAVAYAPDGRCLAATEYKTVTLRDAASGRELRGMEGHATQVVALAFSPDGKLLASSSSPTETEGKTAEQGGALRLWEVASGKLLREITYGGQSQLQILNFSSDGKSLAAWKRYAGITLYDVATGSEICTIRGEFSAVAFSADGKLLATGGSTIRLWELPSGRQLRSFFGSGEMRLLTFSPNGKTLAAVVDAERGGLVARSSLQTHGGGDRPSLGWPLPRRARPGIALLPGDVGQVSRSDCRGG
jgi:WD40 repeat protein